MKYQPELTLKFPSAINGSLLFCGSFCAAYLSKGDPLAVNDVSKLGMIRKQWRVVMLFLLLKIFVWQAAHSAIASPLPFQDEHATRLSQSIKTSDVTVKPASTSAAGIPGMNELILYVPANPIKGAIVGTDSDLGLLMLDKGSADRVKIGYHFQVKSVPGFGQALIQVTAVQKKSSQARIISSGTFKSFGKLLACVTPTYPRDSLAFAARFDETTWQKEQHAIGTFLNELYEECIHESKEKAILILVDEPSERNVVEIRQLDPRVFDQSQQPVVDAVRKYLANQSHFAAIELIETPLPEYHTERPRLWPPWNASVHRKLQLDLEKWQSEILQGSTKDAAFKRLLEFKRVADLAEQASLVKAAEIREATQAAQSSDGARLDKLKTELRVAVDDAFEARQRVQRLEIFALTNDLQKVLSSYDERAKSHSEIVDRRLDDLLNPNYRWDSTQRDGDSLLAKQVPTTNAGASVGNRDMSSFVSLDGTANAIGWQIDPGDQSLEFVVQLPAVKRIAAGEKPLGWIVAIPPEIEGRFNRVVVRSGTVVLSRKPSLEELEQRPKIRVPESIAPSTLSDKFHCWGERVDGELQINIAVSEQTLNLLTQGSVRFQNGQELLVPVPPALVHDASRIVLRVQQTLGAPSRLPD